jgi:hypothetical protein
LTPFLWEETKGLYSLEDYLAKGAISDTKPARTFVVAPVREPWVLAPGIDVISLDRLRDAFRGEKILNKISNAARGPGGLVCMYDRLVTLRGRAGAIPVWML